MLVDGLLVCGSRQNEWPQENVERKIVYTFDLGSQELYDWVDKNTALASYNVGYANHPSRLAQIDNLISINQALQVDLFTQVNAESSGFKQISGNGGMSDYVIGAYWPKGPQLIFCLPPFTPQRRKV
jgi:acyl-CoA hydrolase